MSEVNLICPVTHSEQMRHIAEIESPENFHLIPSDDDYNLKETLRDIFSEMFEEINKTEEVSEQTPEVMFAKYLYVIRMKEEEISKIKATAEALIQDIELWQKRKTDQHKGQIEFLSSRMEGYLRQQDKKSMPLPSGTIGLRKQPPKIEVVDAEQFFDNADDSLIRKIPESVAPDMRAIKERLKSEDKIPGVEVTDQDSKFYYKLY